MDGASGGFRGGGGHTRPVPPLKHFCTIAPPPFFVHVSPLLKRKKKMFRNTEMCRIPPPPFGTCATFDAGGAPKKGRSTPPPPRLSELFWDLRDFRDWRRSKKQTVFCAPPPFNKILDPPLDGAMERWDEGKCM